MWGGYAAASKKKVGRDTLRRWPDLSSTELTGPRAKSVGVRFAFGGNLRRYYHEHIRER